MKCRAFLVCALLSWVIPVSAADAERYQIDAEGNLVAVAVYRSPGKAVTQFVSNVVLLTKFKPAVCAGSPCKMGFPVRIDFKTN